MDLSSWLQYLETLHPKTIDMGLERVSRVADKLGLFPWNTPTITVTGTNGKGSCVAILESIFLASGKRVGAYTSPHIFNYNERIRIQGQAVLDSEICGVFEKIEKARENISLTYFEFGTLAALLLFQKAKLDQVILEVGLGGRLDAVNIIDADIAIITTIAFDHQEYLGTTREAIGYEKAGIARPEKPLIFGDWDVPNSIKNLPMYLQGKDFGYYPQGGRELWSWWGNSRHLMGLPLPVLELQNMSTALKALEFYSVPRAAIIQGLKTVRVPGRFQIIPGKVTHIFDVGHNPAAAACIAKRLAVTPCVGRTLAVAGILARKDHVGILDALKTSVHEWFVGILSEPGDIITAYQQALAVAQPGDRILVFGSHHTVEIVFTYYRGQQSC